MEKHNLTMPKKFRKLYKAPGYPVEPLKQKDNSLLLGPAYEALPPHIYYKNFITYESLIAAERLVLN